MGRAFLTERRASGVAGPVENARAPTMRDRLGGVRGDGDKRDRNSERQINAGGATRRRWLRGVYGILVVKDIIYYIYYKSAF